MSFETQLSVVDNDLDDGIDPDVVDVPDPIVDQSTHSFINTSHTNMQVAQVADDVDAARERAWTFTEEDIKRIGKMFKVLHAAGMSEDRALAVIHHRLHVQEEKYKPNEPGYINLAVAGLHITRVGPEGAPMIPGVTSGPGFMQPVAGWPPKGINNG